MISRIDVTVRCKHLFLILNALYSSNIFLYLYNMVIINSATGEIIIENYDFVSVTVWCKHFKVRIKRFNFFYVTQNDIMMLCPAEA